MMNKLNLRLMIANNTKKRQGVFLVRAVSALLFFSLFLLTEVCSAQTKVVALRDKERIPEENRNFPRDYYFEDQHHDLDKFAGEWEGVGVGNYHWRVRIAVQKRIDCFGDYWSDALGLEPSITKNGKAAITPTMGLIPGTSFIQGTNFRWDKEKKSIDPNSYMVLFSYGEADKPYEAAIVVYLYMNPDQDTIVLRQGVIIAIDEIPNIPDYVIAGGLLAEICTLRRVKK